MIQKIINYITEFPNFEFYNKIVMSAWNSVITEFGLFHLNSPIIIYDERGKYIFETTESQRPIINIYHIPKNISNTQIQWWIEYGVLYKELSKFHICPYDTITLYTFFLALQSQHSSISENMRNSIVNYFCELINIKYLTKFFSFDFIRAQLYWYRWIDSQMIKTNQKHSELWNILVCYSELIWNTKNFIFNNKIQSISKLIYEIIYDDMKSWVQMLKNIYIILYQYFFEEIEQKKITELSTNQYNTNNESHTTNISNDLSQILGNIFEIKTIDMISNIDKKKEREKLLEYFMNKFSSSIPFNLTNDTIIKTIPKSFYILQKLNLVSTIAEANRYWFRFQSKHLLKYHLTHFNFVTDDRDHIKNWNWNDSISKLNIYKSLVTNPIYPFPPFSKKFEYENGISGNEELQYYDLLLLLDSSLSMKELSFGELKTPFDYSVITSFALLHAAFEKRVKFNIINFSQTYITTDWLSATNENLEDAEKLLMKKLNNITIFPFSILETSILKNKNCAVIIITDGKIMNFDVFKKYLNVLNIKLYIFFIGKNMYQANMEQTILSKGGNIYYISEISHLPSIILSTAGMIWNK